MWNTMQANAFQRHNPVIFTSPTACGWFQTVLLSVLQLADMVRHSQIADLQVFQCSFQVISYILSHVVHFWHAYSISHLIVGQLGLKDVFNGRTQNEASETCCQSW